MILHIARIAPLLAALFCWRVTRPAAGALLVAFAASLLYLNAPWEPLRWVSAAVGLVGARVLWERAEARAVLFGNHYRRARDMCVSLRLFPGADLEDARAAMRFGREDWIGLLLFASAAGDGAAYLVWIRLNEWVMPVAQIVVCVAIAVIARWPERRNT